MSLPSPSQRLRASPSFSFALMPDGRPYVSRDTEPYVQYWLTDVERRLLAAFSARAGATVAQALAACAGPADGPGVQRRLLKSVGALLDAGVLADPQADPSRYDARIVAHYLRHRPFPPEIAAAIVQRSALQPSSPLLDLAGGPGDLALQLAQHSSRVALMDWSRAFLASARRRARDAGLTLQTVHESCNRLLHDDGRYHVVTVAQALHWLDDVAVCRGVARVLRPGGHFFVVHSAFDVPDAHPLAHVLGHDSVLGAKRRIGFAREVQALHERVRLLLQALDTPDVDRVDSAPAAAAPLAPAGLLRWRQRRVLGLGFLRALLSDRHLTDAGLAPADFWADVQRRVAAAPASDLMGTHDWALLHFARQTGPAARVSAARVPVHEIGCSAPP